MEIVFSYPHERCPQCNSRLKSYRVDRRKVKCAEGSFIALHRIMICPVERIKFRSEKLDLIIPPKCTYSNEVMVASAMKRFINGRKQFRDIFTYGCFRETCKKAEQSGT